MTSSMEQRRELNHTDRQNLLIRFNCKNESMIEVRQLRYFIAVAELLHFGRAAEREHITQAALSEQIARLETHLGVKLFDRTSRRVRLTRAGETMLPEAHLTLEQLDRTVMAAREADAGAIGRLTVGFQWNAYPWIALARRQFEWEHPRVQVVYRQAAFGDPTGGINDPDIDVAFVTPPFRHQSDLDVTILAREQRVVAVSNEHPWATRPMVSLDELVNAPLVTLTCTDKICREFWELDRERGQPAQRLDPEPVTIDEWLNEIERGTHIAVTAAAAQNAYGRPTISFIPAPYLPHATTAIATKRPNDPLIRSFITTVARLANPKT